MHNTEIIFNTISTNLTFVCPFIVSIIANDDQQDATKKTKN